MLLLLSTMQDFSSQGKAAIAIVDNDDAHALTVATGLVDAFLPRALTMEKKTTIAQKTIIDSRGGVVGKDLCPALLPAAIVVKYHMEFLSTK